MASETRCTVTVDESHDPPRWLRVDGLRMFDMWDQLGVKTGFLMGVVAIILIGLASYFASDWFTSSPGSVYVFAVVIGTVMGTSILMYRRSLRLSEIRSLQAIPSEDQTIHFKAIFAAFYSRTSWRSKWFMVVDVDAYFNQYRSHDCSPPSVILYNAKFPTGATVGKSTPLRLKGDPPMGTHWSIRAWGWFKFMFWALLVFSSISLMSLLFSSNRADVSWQTIVAMSNTFLMSAFMIYQSSFAASRSAVQIDRGRVGFTKWYRRRSLTREEALCTVYSMFGLVTLQWHMPGRTWPVHTLYFRDPEDPRLATILNLWTADPLPDSAA